MTYTPNRLHQNDFYREGLCVTEITFADISA